MDPKFLTQLAVIVELGSVSKAARKLNVTQPTLSRSVRIIEDRVGSKVLHRERYGVSPTEIGSRLAEEGRAILRRSEQARGVIEEWRHGLSGELRVGVGPMLATTILCDFFAQQAEDAPSYSLKLHCEVASGLARALSDGNLDMALFPYDLNRFDDHLLRQEIYQDRLQVFVAATDPLVGQRAVPPPALAEHHWIAISETSGLFEINSEMLNRMGLPHMVPRLENTGDVVMTFRILETTKSYSLLPGRTVSSFAGRYGIAPIDLDETLPERNIGLWTRRDTNGRPEVVDFTKRLIQFLEKKGLR